MTPSTSYAAATPPIRPSPTSSKSSSAPAVAISPRVAVALRHRAEGKNPSPTRSIRGGFVFHRPDGRPLHPECVLNHFHQLCHEFGVPRTTIHDLRHLVATITAGVPLTVVSKTLRHATLSISHQHLRSPHHPGRPRRRRHHRPRPHDRRPAGASPRPATLPENTQDSRTPDPGATQHGQGPDAEGKLIPTPGEREGPSRISDITMHSQGPENALKDRFRMTFEGAGGR
ncbi:tyrosine-type recombinase/integrase [Kitasatospora sp. NPDC056783]|uniref:tyrosine-type recombinase/integrase n=1 Tax=Kitasatospora sp. NPDC056783 TaxID=3345943 RepID=UPI00367E52E1